MDPFAEAAALDPFAEALSSPQSLLGSPGPQGAPPTAPPLAVAAPTPVARPARAVGVEAPPVEARGTTAAIPNPVRSAPVKKRFHVSAKLSVAAVEQTAGMSMVATVFLKPADVESSCNVGKRKREEVMPTPVPLWPQYTIAGVAGRFIVVSSYEQWVVSMMHCVKVRNGGARGEHGVNWRSGASFRDLNKAVSVSLRAMLRKSLEEVKAAKTHMFDDDDDADSEPKIIDKRTNHTFSGFELKNVLLVNVVVADRPLTILNNGRLFIVALDAASISFIQEDLPRIIKNLTVTRRLVCVRLPGAGRGPWWGLPLPLNKQRYKTNKCER